MDVKFMWNGIKVDGVLHRCSYTYNQGFTPNEIHIYAKEYGYGALPINIGICVKNDSDGMIDYFEHDRATLCPGDKWYDEAYDAWKKGEARMMMRCIKRVEARIRSGNAMPSDEYYLKEYKERLRKVS